MRDYKLETKLLKIIYGRRVAILNIRYGNDCSKNILYFDIKHRVDLADHELYIRNISTHYHNNHIAQTINSEFKYFCWTLNYFTVTKHYVLAG